MWLPAPGRGLRDFLCQLRPWTKLNNRGSNITDGLEQLLGRSIGQTVRFGRQPRLHRWKHMRETWR